MKKLFWLVMIGKEAYIMRKFIVKGYISFTDEQGFEYTYHITDKVRFYETVSVIGSWEE